jgi:hypothetical protein
MRAPLATAGDRAELADGVLHKPIPKFAADGTYQLNKAASERK